MKSYENKDMIDKDIIGYWSQIIDGKEANAVLLCNGDLFINGEFKSTLGWHGFQMDDIQNKVRRIFVSDGVKRITAGLFRDFTALEYVQLPKSVETIEPYAFCNCVNLKEVSYI